jgi:DNA-binding transcriptional ArsR family regulator
VSDAEISTLAGLMADPARARILWSLIDGTTRPAGELAYSARVSAQSASAHLAKLVAGGLISCEPHGRHRYFRIASSEVAAVVEGLASLGAAKRPRSPRPPLPSASVPVEFLNARTCYGHLAGEKAVRVLEAMLERRWLVVTGRDYSITRLGEMNLTQLGIDIGAARSKRRVFARACVDLTQRRPHLGGALGDALLDVYVKQGWIQRYPRSRVVAITPKGDAAFGRWFGM